MKGKLITKIRCGIWVNLANEQFATRKYMGGDHHNRDVEPRKRKGLLSNQNILLM